VVIPDFLPENMIVAIRPSEEYQDKYWIAKILKQSSDRNYRVHYYKYNGAKKSFTLCRGKDAKGICPIGAILVAGVNLNVNGNVTAASLRHIEYALNK
jgi:hypothetical protein